jgi:hypothetical protein
MLTKKIERIKTLRKSGFYLDALEAEAALFHELLARAHDVYVSRPVTDDTDNVELLRDLAVVNRELVLKPLAEKAAARTALEQTP